MTMDEIVRALRCCERENCGDSSQCPLYSDSDCITHLSGPTADLIEKLTAENADLLKELEWQGMIIALAQRKQAEAEAERDAAIADLKISSGCTSCKYHCSDTIFCRDCTKKQNCKCMSCSLGLPNWEWRGLPEAPEGGEKDADCQRRD